MPLNALPDDYYDYDEQAQRLEGRHNGWQFNIGMHVRVKVTEVTPISGGILVEWVEGGCKITTKSRKLKIMRKTALEKPRWNGKRGHGRSICQVPQRKGKAVNEKDADHA